MKAKKSIIFIGLIIGSIITLMNACGQMYLSGDLPSKLLPSVGPPLTSDEINELQSLENFKSGEKLYQKHCISCHKASSVSQNRDVTWEDLRTVTGGQKVKEMSKLKIDNFSLQKIWLALNYRQSDFIKLVNPEASSFSHPRGTANFIASKMTSIFNPGSKNKVLAQKIDLEIARQNISMGERCSNYDKLINPIPKTNPSEKQLYKLETISGCTPPAGKTGTMQPSNSVLRQARIEKTCQSLLVFKISVQNVLEQVEINVEEEINKNSIQMIIELFFPGMPYEDSLTNSLFEVSENAKKQNLDNYETWGALMHPLCTSLIMDKL